MHKPQRCSPDHMLEAFEMFVALALENEGLVVSEALKFPVPIQTAASHKPRLTSAHDSRANGGLGARSVQLERPAGAQPA